MAEPVKEDRLKATRDMVEARRRFREARKVSGQIQAAGDALQERKKSIREQYGVLMGEARRFDADAELMEGAQARLSPGSSVKFFPEVKRQQAQEFRDSAAGMVNDWNQEWRKNRHDLEVAQSRVPMRGYTPDGSGFNVQQRFTWQQGGGIKRESTLLSDDNRAFIEMRNETPEEFRARRRAAVENEIAQARRERNANRLVENPDGTIGYSGHASMSADTGMAVGSRAATEHGAALARIGGSGIYGGQYANDRLSQMRAANRAPGFGRSHPIGRRRDDMENAAADRALRREEFMARAGIAHEQIAGENQRAANNLEERRRQFNETLGQRERERRDARKWALEDDKTARDRFEQDRTHDEARADARRQEDRKWALEDDKTAADRAKEEYNRMSDEEKRKVNEELETIKGNWGAIIHTYLSQDIDAPPPSLTEYMYLVGGENAPSVAQKDYHDFIDLLEQRRESIRAQRKTVG